MTCPFCPYYEQKTSYGTEMIWCNNTECKDRRGRWEDMNKTTAEWIKVSARTLTEEEMKESESEAYIMLECPLPEDCQEVLLTVHGWNGPSVVVDMFCEDLECGSYFENWDWEDIIAWAPMPEPYREEEQTCGAANA